MATYQLTGTLFMEMIRGGAENLRANASVVNDLNVFPIPDGDTGENMSLTLDGGAAAIAHTPSVSLQAVSDALAQGMLMSARGNSGVILSQFFAGIAKGFQRSDSAGLPEVGEAFRAGVKKAYEAVMTPAEGTILTVAREATEYACDRLNADSSLESFFADYIQELHASLDRTPDLLAVLKEAGVVDSGGAGLIYVMEGMNRVLRGEEIVSAAPAEKASAPLDFSSFNEESEMEFGYCTEFLLQLQKSKVDTAAFDVNTVTTFLQTIGNSIVAFKTGTIIKVHVHTMTPGKVLDFCQQFGEFLTLKIENMAIQHNESVIENRFTPKPAEKRKQFGVVAVASGAGVKQTFADLGADVVVEGGQTMNPSAEDLMEAFERVNAETIFVFPNNGNIILAAHQAAGLYQAADIRVIESKTIGDGYAALSMMDLTSGDADAIAASFKEAMDGVVTGMVTHSIRNANLNGISIHTGDYIGMIGKEMLADAPDKVSAACALLEHIDWTDREVLIVIYGKGTTQEELDALSGRVRAAHPYTEVCPVSGGQDIYNFILIAE